MIAALVALTLHADPLVLYVTPFTGEDVREDVRAYQAERIANDLRLTGVKVIDDVKAADATLSAALTHMGATGMKVDLEVALTADGKVVAARSIQAMSDEELNGMMQAAAQEIARQLFERLGREPVTQPEAKLPKAPPSYASTLPGLVVGLAGAIAAGGGVALTQIAKANIADVHDGRPATYPAAMAEAGQAQTFSTVGIGLIVVGGVALLGGATYAVIVGRTNTSLDVTAFIGPNGSGGIVIGGRF